MKSKSKPAWASRFESRWERLHRSGALKSEAGAIRKGVALLSDMKIPASKLELPEQPFDRALLALSPLFRRSREEFLRGGRFHATLLSSPRSLSSAGLLEQTIEYSPVERELIWAASDPIESKHSERLLGVRTYATSLFHEQNHRILWRLLPPAPRTTDGLRRYLNYAESLVIATDMALGDQLGPSLSQFFYLCGVTYDPGTSILREFEWTRRAYRNYLQAAVYSTYLNLEFYRPKDIPKAVGAHFPGLGSFAERVCQRSGRLDRQFIARTNQIWQHKHRRETLAKLSRKKGAALALPSDPMDNRDGYLFAEKWFEAIGL